MIWKVFLVFLTLENFIFQVLEMLETFLFVLLIL